MKNTKQFYEDLAYKESSNKPKTINKYGYLGLYQMGEDALIDVGYYRRGELDKTPRINDWTGIWTGKNGVKGKKDFLFNPEVQHKAIKEYHSLIWNKYLKDYHQHEGKEIKGMLLTKAGMVACGHLVGQKSLKKFIDSDGNIDKSDKNHITCTKYMKDFANYELNFNVNIEHQESEQSADDIPWDKINSMFDKDQEFSFDESLAKLTAEAFEMGNKAIEAQRQMQEEGILPSLPTGDYKQDALEIVGYSEEILRRAWSMSKLEQEEEEII